MMLQTVFGLIKARKDPAAVKTLAAQMAREGVSAPVQALALKARIYFAIAGIITAMSAAGTVYLALSIHGLFYILTFIICIIALMIWLAFRGFEGGYKRAGKVANRLADRAMKKAERDNAS